MISRCSVEFNTETEDQITYCPGWNTYNQTCFDETNEEHYSYTYKTADDTESLFHIGNVAEYNGGGYVRDIGPTHNSAANSLKSLREQVWIDEKTRALFVDAVLLNGDTMLFSHVKVVFELPSFGGVIPTFRSTTSNLYPYIDSLDYMILLFQIIFIVIIFVRIVLLIISIFKTKCSCFSSLGTWILLLEISLSIAAVVVYILRIDQTIEAIERVFNDIGK